MLNYLTKLIKRKFNSLSIVKNKKAKTNGKEGERQVAYTINNHLTKFKGRLLNNVIFQSRNYSTQIDHIIISNNRNIIVIETKNFKGFINGDISDNYWYQNLGKKSYKFKNPILQNENHIKALNNVLKWNNISEYNIINLVVFMDKCELNTKSDNVIYLHELEDKLRKYLYPCKNNAEDIYSVIKSKGFINKKSAVKKHMKYIKKIS